MTTSSYIFTLIMLTSTTLFGQTQKLCVTTRTEIKNFELKHFQSLTKKYKKLINSGTDINILYIYSLDLNDSLKIKKYFKDETFVSYLKVIKSNKKRYLYGQSFALRTSDKRIILGGQDDQVFEFPNSDYLNKSYEQIARAISTYNQIALFHISGSNSMIYFGLTDDDIYVFDISKNVTYILIDFVDNNWDDLLFGRP